VDNVSNTFNEPTRQITDPKHLYEETNDANIRLHKEHLSEKVTPLIITAGGQLCRNGKGSAWDGGPLKKTQIPNAACPGIFKDEVDTSRVLVLPLGRHFERQTIFFPGKAVH